MVWKIILSFIFILFLILSLVFYWLVPFRTIEFSTQSENSNFSLNNYVEGNMQFYPNMRYQDSEISYRIEDCSLKKTNDMEQAFEIISNLSVLEFYPVDFGEKISVTCDEKTRIEEGLFIAGEGGPTNITKSGNFYVISKGKILLIKDSKCRNPNIALHELLHALGFDHSENSDNIMFYLSKCEQVIGQDQINLINEIYSVQSYPDIVIENVSAVMNGRYLDVNLSIRNNGLADSEEMELLIYADQEFIKEIELDALKIGHGKLLMLTHVWIKKINVNEIEFVINSSFDEPEKNNNRIKIGIKNKN